MSTYCYHCGTKMNGQRICPRCGTDLHPPIDVYCNAQTCDDENCGVDVPRWSRFCPVCGRKLMQYDPYDIEARRSRFKGLVLGAFVWMIILFVLAVIISKADENIPIKYTLIVAGVLSIFLWITVFRKRERGKILDGTVIRHWTEEATESSVVPDEQTLLGHRRFEQIAITKYKTEIRWDNGKLHTTSMDNCAANHIQLAPGDRVRKFISTGDFVKL